MPYATHPSTMLRALTAVSSPRFLAVFAAAVSLLLAPTMLLNFVVDPYDMNGLIDLGIDKRKLAYPLNYKLYKLAAFKRNPLPNLMLGDSRSDALREEFFARQGALYFNMSFPGGTLRDQIDAFWWATGQTKLRSVVFGVPFHLFSDGNAAYVREQKALFAQAQELVGNPWAYYQSVFVRRVSWLGLKSLLGATDAKGSTGDEAPPRAAQPKREEARWQRILASADAPLRDWQDPQALVSALEAVHAYAVRHGIALSFFVPPDHVDLQDKIREFGLENRSVPYTRQLAGFGTVFDYAVPSALTRDPGNYDDPFHFRNNVAEWLVQDMLARGLPP